MPTATSLDAGGTTHGGGRFVRRVAMLWAMLLAIAGSSPAKARPDVILYQMGAGSVPEVLVRNQSYVRSLPFDGVTLNIAASWDLMRDGYTASYNQIYGQDLAPLKTTLNPYLHNYVLVTVRGTSDPFDDWGPMITSWVTLARAARDAGCAGIFFDNEEYHERRWHYPEDVKHRAYSLAAYRSQYRARGQQLIQAVARVWPSVRLIVAHGPYISEPRTPRSVIAQQASLDAADLSGSFFVGLLGGTPPTARVIDGGEFYLYRTAQDFTRSYGWRKQDLPALSPNDLIPAGLRQLWSARSSIGFGLYDLTWKPGYPMTPAILQSSLRNALAAADDVVWLFAETDGPRQYLLPGRGGADWLAAIRAARGAAPSGAQASATP